MQSERQTLAPACRVRVNGSELPPQVAADLVTATVQDDIGAPGMFTLRLNDWDADQLRVNWMDDRLFAEGNEVAIEMGYVDQLQTLMTGELTGLEPEFSAASAPMLTVRGYDLRHRLLRGRKTRSFTRMKDSDIASQIAGDFGLTPQVEDTGVTLDYVLQSNETDMEFLERRAQLIGYEIAVDNRTMAFRPRQNTGSTTLTLTRDADLLEFHLRASTMAQVGQVSVRGWDLKAKAGIVARAGAGDEGTTMGGSNSGAQVADRAFGQTAAARVDSPIATQAEADQIARGRFREMALAYVTGDGLTVGRTDLKAGQVISIEGLGNRFSGLYYVISTTHTFSPRSGYRTRFRVRRNAT